MAGVWDSNMKRLVGINPQAFVTWLLGNAQVVQELSGHLNRAVDIDILYEVILDGERVLLHIEFQRYRDIDMAERIWEYNVFASRKFSCTVISFVIYLKEDRKVAEPPLLRVLPDGQEIHRFNFFNIKLWELSTKELMEAGLIGLLPLLPLTREGSKREVIEEVVTKLLQVEDKLLQKDMLTIAFTLSSLALDVQEDKEWLFRRFKMLQDIIRDTEIYQYIMQEGIEKGREQGIEKGREQGIEKGREQERQKELERLRQMLIAFVQARYTELVPFATAQAEQINNVEALNELTLNVGLAQNLEEVRSYLQEANSKEKH